MRAVTRAPSIGAIGLLLGGDAIGWAVDRVIRLFDWRVRVAIGLALPATGIVVRALDGRR
jgi:hypothetical protein